MTISQDRQDLGTKIEPLRLDFGDEIATEQLERLRNANPHLKLERSADGRSISLWRHEVLPELSPEETARRVAIVERYRHSRQQIIDSLSPAELEESNHQFDEMFKTLDESRK
jgi:hypothetical protein